MFLFDEIAFPNIYSTLYHHYGESIVTRLTNLFGDLVDALAPGDTLNLLANYKTDLLVNNKLTSRVRYIRYDDSDILIPVENSMFYYSNLHNTQVIDTQTELVEMIPDLCELIYPTSSLQ